MGLINPVVLILAGILALSGAIVARRPDARQMIDRLVPYQAVIGVCAIGAAILTLILRRATLTDSFNASFASAALWAMIGASIILGFLFGMPIIASKLGNNQFAQQKMAEVTKMIAPFQALVGVFGIIAALMSLYYFFTADAALLIHHDDSVRSRAP